LIKTRFGYPTNFQVDARNYYLKSEEEMRRLGFPGEYYDHTWEVAQKCRVELDKIALNGTPGALEAAEAVFSSRLMTIDARQAIEDTAGVLSEDEDELKQVLALIPPSSDLAGVYRNIAPFREWVEKRPKLWELAIKLEGLPRSSEPDFEKVLNIPLGRAKEVIPLKKCRGEVMVQYPFSTLEKIGVSTYPVGSFRESRPAFYARVQKRSTLNEARLLFKK